MKTLFFSIVAFVFASLSVQAEDTSVFRHAVFFKFKAEATADEVAEIEKAFAELPSKIDTITDFEWGTVDNVEPLNDEFTHCFFVSFEDKAGLEVYLPHPDHKAFVALLRPKLDKVFVFDYTPKG
ncbi:MAG: Dabb family protein, partial [Verrucomicrobiota bacterium]